MAKWLLLLMVVFVLAITTASPAASAIATSCRMAGNASMACRQGILTRDAIPTTAA